MTFQDSPLIQIKEILSSDRFAAYCIRSGGEDLDALCRYLWNVTLSESLYPSLQNLEIALRNSIHSTLSNAYDTSMWFDIDPPWLYHIEVEKLREVKAKLIKQGKNIQAGRIVADLTFGFWTNLFDSRYEQILWPKHLKSVFPYAPKHMRTRQLLSKQLNKIRYLRNRVFHHEPIWYWKDLQEQHQKIVETLGWISPQLQGTLSIIDRFPDVYQQGHQSYKDCLLSFLEDSQ